MTPDAAEAAEADTGIGTPSATRAAISLRHQIISGDMRPGQPLREAALCAELDVSRNTLREALRQLAVEGLVDQILHKGSAVRRMTAEDVRDIFRARRALQLYAIAVSPAAAPEKRAVLEAAMAQGLAAMTAGDWKAAGTASLHFHQAIVGLIGSRKLDDFFLVLSAQLSLALVEARGDARFQSIWPARNRDILDCLRAGALEAAEAALMSFIEASEYVVTGIVGLGWSAFLQAEAARLAALQVAPRFFDPARMAAPADSFAQYLTAQHPTLRDAG